MPIFAQAAASAAGNGFDMKRIILIMSILSMFGLGSCAQDRAFESVSVTGFEAAVSDSTVVLVDVRTAAEHAQGFIPGTVANIDVLGDDFAEKAAKLPSDKTIAIYCRSGNRSKTAARILVDKGYKVVELASGFNGWVSAGKEVSR